MLRPKGAGSRLESGLAEPAEQVSSPAEQVSSPAERAVAVSVEGDEFAIDKKASWVTVGLLQVGDVVGTGILALGAGVALIGWVPGVLLLLGGLAVNIYAGVILQEVYLAFPSGRNLPLMAKAVFQNGAFTALCWVFYYLFFVCLLSQYVQVLGSSLNALLIYLELCNYEFTLLGCLVVLPLVQGRTLAAARPLMVVNMVSITLCVLISVVWMLCHMGSSDAQTVAFNVDASYNDVLSALNKFVFAYNGNVVYPEMLDEMAKPAKFYKAFFLSSPYQLAMYSFAALTQYGYQGAAAASSGALRFQAIPTANPLYGVCAFLLLVHVAMAYVVKATIMARALHLRLSPDTVNERGPRARAIWLAITVTLLIGAWIISSSIPSFNALMDITAAFVITPLGLVLPPLLTLGVRRRAGALLNRANAALFALASFGIAMTFMGAAQAVMGAKTSFDNGEPPFYC